MKGYCDLVSTIDCIMKKILRYFKKLFINIGTSLKYGGITHIKVDKVISGTLLKGRVILITGGGSGIGKAMALRFLEEGATVVITGRDEDKLSRVCKEFNSSCLHYRVLDMHDTSIFNDFMCEITKEIGYIDTIVNNAGVYMELRDISANEREWDEIIGTNLKGVFFLSKTFIIYARAKSLEANILNISSIAGVQSISSPYHISKAAVNALTRSLAKTCLSSKIKVNAIAPGETVSEINPRKENIYSNDLPNMRYIAAEEIAELALFLVSNQSVSITGQTIVIDGGATLYY